jgi:uncharacterized protein (DUF2126 family)
VDTPLTFDVIDKWNNRSVGGFNYFVSHPGGRSYDTFPVNSYEAESRRINRYWDFNHTQGEIQSFDPTVTTQSISTPTKAPVRLITPTKRIKVMQYHEMPVNAEYPLTLDLRQRWTKA